MALEPGLFARLSYCVGREQRKCAVEIGRSYVRRNFLVAIGVVVLLPVVAYRIWMGDSRIEVTIRDWIEIRLGLRGTVEKTETPIWERIRNGETFQVVFTASSFPDPDCGVSRQSSPMGNLKNGATYSIVYNRHNGDWVTSGPNQEEEDCPIRANDAGKYMTLSPQARELNLWGRAFRFDDHGRVFDENPGAMSHHVGYIKFPSA